MSRVRIAVFGVLVGLVLSVPASAALPGRETLSAAKDAASGALGRLNAAITVHTRNFVAEYSVNDLYVIEAARIAQLRSSSPRVRAAAASLAADARISESELQRLLRSYNVDAVPATALDFRRRSMIGDLNATRDFDRRYIAQQVQAKTEQRILLRRYAGSGRIVAVKQFADRRLQRVEDLLLTLRHLQRGA